MCEGLGTKDQYNMLMDVIERHKDSRGSLIPILHDAQEIYGYLPMEVQKVVAQKLDIPLANIYGVVTFYTRFLLEPKGKYNVSVCMGTACYVKGAGDLLEAVKERLGIDCGECTKDGKFSLEATRCIGACGLAPVLTVNEDVYGRLKVEDIDSLLAKYM